MLAVQVQTNHVSESRLNFPYSQKNEFYTLGVFVVLSIAYGNSGIPFLAEPVFDYISTNSYCMAIPESQIPDIELQRVVCQVNIHCYI